MRSFLLLLAAAAVSFNPFTPLKFIHLMSRASLAPRRSAESEKG
jgi:hypothetical protein